MARSARRQWWIALFACVAGAALVASVRARLFAIDDEVVNRHDVYFLPPPEQVETMSLGYEAAMADVLWAHVLVSQGLHTFEQRRFENLTRLYDAINELAPKWRTPYLLADALITFQAETTPYEEVLEVRKILERGVEHRPYDEEIWLNLGQFVSFVAPGSYLHPDHPEVAERWRREGVAYLQRAAELGAGRSGIAWQALGGANILAEQGRTSAAIRFLKRTHATTDDPALRRDIEERLEKMIAQREEAQKAMADIELEAYRARQRAFEAVFDERLPFVGRDQGLVLGPPSAPARCAGPGHPEVGCATTWRTWAERFERRARAGGSREPNAF